MHHSPWNCFLLADLVHAWITSGVETTNKMHSNVNDKGRLFIAQSVHKVYFRWQLVSIGQLLRKSCYFIRQGLEGASVIFGKSLLVEALNNVQ